MIRYVGVSLHDVECAIYVPNVGLFEMNLKGNITVAVDL